MRLHQILTGSCNHYDQCLANGSIQNIPFIAYASGCNLVILDGEFKRVQVIPGVTIGNIQITCVDCCQRTGKIAVSYGKRVCLFEAEALDNDGDMENDGASSSEMSSNNGSASNPNQRRLGFKWSRSIMLEAKCSVLDLAWCPLGDELVTSGDWLQMWRPQKPGFSLYVDDESDEDENVSKFAQQWNIVWETKYDTAKSSISCTRVSYSSDGQLFATASNGNNKVLIWYQDKFSIVSSSSNQKVSYSFCVLNHPAPVTAVYWRRTSRYMPQGSVANTLLTSCKDQVCRIWSESRLKDCQGLNATQGEPSLAMDAPTSTSSQSSHKFSILEQISKIRQLNFLHNDGENIKSDLTPPLKKRDSDCEPTAVKPKNQFLNACISKGPTGSHYPHFSMVATISPRSDMPLLPTKLSMGRSCDFVLHWLNNKDLQFTSETERHVEELTRYVLAGGIKNPDNNGRDANEQSPSAGEYGSISSLSLEMRQQIAQLDRKLDLLLADWKRSSDVLFTIHPVDGSLLVWLVHWLDESSACGADGGARTRHVQVSVSSRLPDVVPIGDALSMSPNLLLYCPGVKLCAASILASLLDSQDQTIEDDASRQLLLNDVLKLLAQGRSLTSHSNSSKSTGNSANENLSIMLVSKHENGSLNQWELSLSEGSKFSCVMSMVQLGRISGHRFHTNSAVCHPSLPLLLTTSHHNAPNEEPIIESEANFLGEDSELIMWKVDSVGPLSRGGGIIEIARVNSPKQCAFSSVAWFPALVPCSILGIASKSPAALFTGSTDQNRLVLYLAVVDARSIIRDHPSGQQLGQDTQPPLVPEVNVTSADNADNLKTASVEDSIRSSNQGFRVVSLQSTAKPGCIVELDQISDQSMEDKRTLLLHVFSEEMVTGKRSSKSTQPSSSTIYMGPPHQQSTNFVQDTFDETYFVTRLHKHSTGGSRNCWIEMWRVELLAKAKPKNLDASGAGGWCPGDSDGFEDSFGSSFPQMQPPKREPTLDIGIGMTSTKVCSQMLAMPPGVEVINATVAAGHLSSASIYPACFAPYLLSTVCSDAVTRFWKCQLNVSSGEFEWCEWRMLLTNHLSSAITLPASTLPISVTCAYSGRVAIAYKTLQPKVDTLKPAGLNDEVVDLKVAIYECESTGGSEWILEDTIELNHVKIPSVVIKRLAWEHHRILTNSINPGKRPDWTNSVYEQDFDLTNPDASKQKFSMRVQDMSAPTNAPPEITDTRKHIVTKKKRCVHPAEHALLLKPKHLIQLDWVSTEDGSHLLSVAVGTNILIYAAVCRDIVMATTRSRQTTLMTSSMDEIKWMKLRLIELETADDLPAFPMHASWVREGLMVVGLDNEIHVYSQWMSNSALTEDLHTEPTLTETKKHSSTDSKKIRRNESKTSLADDHRSLMDQSLALPSASMSMARLTKTYSAYKLSYSPSNHNLQQKTAPSIQSKFKAQSSLDGLTLDFIKYIGLFEAVQVCNPVLPQYHPRQLIEWMNFGKLRRVKAILSHLTRCVVGKQVTEKLATKRPSYIDDSYNINLDGKKEDSVGEVPSATRDAADSELRAIPPLPLYALLAVDSLEENIPSSTSEQPDNLHDMDLLGSLPDELDIDVLDMEDDNSFKSKSDTARQRNHSSGPGNATSELAVLISFTPLEASILSERLTRHQLPGLSALDQMYLLGIAELMANMRTEVTERLHATKSTGGAGKTTKSSIPSSSSGKRGLVRMNTMGEGTGGYVTPETSLDSLDDCGLRFMMSMQHFSYLLMTLPMKQRNLLQNRGLDTSHLVWAFHSEAEEELLSRVPSMAREEISWSDFRMYGCAWWIRNINTLKRCIEKIARNTFQKTKDPMDAAIFYTAMRKPRILSALFKNSGNTALENFFRGDFSQPTQSRKAKVNAFNLLSKRRFTHAAALFLAAGSLKDAVLVCLDNLKDLQLAMVIGRLYESELGPANSPGTSFNDILRDQVIKNNDPFKRSMAHWSLGEHEQALQTLLDSPPPSSNSSQTGSASGKWNQEEATFASSNEDDSYASTKINVFNFYTFLRGHPLLMRKRLYGETGGAATGPPGVHSVGTLSQEQLPITSMERRLFFKTAYMYVQLGCPALALEVLSKLPEIMFEDGSVESTNPVTNSLAVSTPPAVTTTANPIQSQLDTGLFTWDMDTPKKEEEFKIQWSDDEEEEAEDDIDDIKKKANPIGVDNQKSAQQQTGTIDIMAHQLKFIACLKIISEELSTLATGIEPDGGGQLRYHFYIWLEREVEVLQHLCNYNTGLQPEYSMEDVLTGGSVFPGASSPNSESIDARISVRDSSPTGLSRTASKKLKHRQNSVLCTENLSTSPNNNSIAEEDVMIKINRLEKRRNWLKSHECLLRSLMSFCSLQGASGVGLASLRMELLLLLQELHQNAAGKLHTRLPIPTNLPLISAALAPSKTLLANPIHHLKCLIRDILDSLISIRCPFVAQEVNKLNESATHAQLNSPASNTQSTDRNLIGQQFDELLLVPGCANDMEEKQILLLRNLSSALSTCIFQSLSDVDGLMVKKEGHQLLSRFYVGYQSFQSERNSSRMKHRGTLPPQVSSKPSKWPGTSTLQGFLRYRSDNDTPNLHMLLCQALVAVYLGLLYYALHSSDSNLLYRLAHVKLDSKLWARVYGGGAVVKNKDKVSTPAKPPERPPPPSPKMGSSPSKPSRPPPVSIQTVDRKLSPTIISVSKPSLNQPSQSTDPSLDKRQKLVNQVVSSRPQKPNIEEIFIQPQSSILSCLLEKPEINRMSPDFVYDSDCEEVPVGYEDFSESSPTARPETEDFDEEDDLLSIGNDKNSLMNKIERERRRRGDSEWMNTKSYSWCLIRYIMVKRAHDQIMRLFQILELETTELAVTCPYLYQSLKRLTQCQRFYKETLDWMGNPPESYCSSIYMDSDAPQPTTSTAVNARAMNRFKSLLDPTKTPFNTQNPYSLPLKRLWCYLVKQESVQEIFMRYVYRQCKPEPERAINDWSLNSPSTASHSKERLPLHPGDVIKVVHKEPDPVVALCVNQANLNLIALSTPKEVVEIDITNLINPPVWLEDEIEYDIEVIRKPSTANLNEDFVMIERPSGSQSLQSSIPSAPGVLPAPREPGLASTHPGNVITKRSLPAIQSMTPHPSLPYYMCGGSNGHLQMFEWDHHTPIISTMSSPCHRGKINALKFDDSGRKFGVGDSDGMFGLFHLSLASSSPIPFFSHRCHSRGVQDFSFLNSSSVLATAGFSAPPGSATTNYSDNRDSTLAIWDTLMPLGKSAVQQYSDSVLDVGCTAVCPASRHQLLIVGTKRGEIVLVDLRQATVRHSFLAHEGPVKSILLDPIQEFFITGSADGNIKIWRLGEHELISSYRGEHVIKKALFSQSEFAGVSQLYLCDPFNRLLSCGADGALKMRQLDPKLLFKPSSDSRK